MVAMTKKNAFLIHLAFSLIIFAILVLMIIYVWYPAPYFDTAYRMKWIKIIAFVDLVIGPGLTLLVFKPNKPSLKFDLSVIFIVQMIALSWGVYNAWSVHPKTTVFFENQVYCFDRNEFKDSGASETFRKSPLPASIVAYLPYPDSIEQKKEYLESSKGRTGMVYGLGYLFEPVADTNKQVFAKQQPDIMQVVNANEDYKKVWTNFMESQTQINPDWRYYTFACFEDKKTLVLDYKKNKVEAVLDIGLPLSWIFN